MAISPRQVVEQWKMAKGSGDESTYRRLTAEDVEWVVPPSAPCCPDPNDPVIRGRDLFLSLSNTAEKLLFKPGSIRVEERFAFEHENTFVEEWTMWATAHNGRPYKNDYCNIWTINDRGEIQRVSEYIDMAVWQATFVPGLLLKI